VSGQLHDVGSIVDFWPGGQHRQTPAGWASDIAGVALVVVARSQWVIRTELRIVRLIDGRYVVDQSEGSVPDVQPA
jgi:hypothetical protein